MLPVLVWLNFSRLPCGRPVCWWKVSSCSGPEEGCDSAVIIWLSEAGWAQKEVTKIVPEHDFSVHFLTDQWTVDMCVSNGSNADMCSLFLNQEQVAEQFMSFWTLINCVDKTESGICKRMWWLWPTLLTHYSSLAKTGNLQGNLKKPPTINQNKPRLCIFEISIFFLAVFLAYPPLNVIWFITRQAFVCPSQNLYVCILTIKTFSILTVEIQSALHHKAVFLWTD